VTALALALAAGVGLGLAGAPILAAPLAAALLMLPDAPWTRPADRLPVVAGFVILVTAGWAHGRAADARSFADCRWGLRADSVSLVGSVVTLDAPGRLRVRVLAGLPGGCRATLRVVAPRGADPRPGARVRVRGRWSPTGGVRAGDPLRAGVVLAAEVEPIEAGATAAGAGGSASAGGGADEADDVDGANEADGVDGPGGAGAWPTTVGPGETVRRAAARLRGLVDEALGQRMGGEAALARALVVARRDGLDPEVRAAFTRSGTAHLLAISGFHVGVVALLAMSLVRLARASRRSAATAGAIVACAYAAVLGFPDAATRAALLVSVVASGRALGRPVLAVGALSSALVVLLLVDPTGLARIGFQLSFAGSFGLALLARPISLRLRAWLAVVPVPRGLSRTDRAPGWWISMRDAVVDGVAASLAATVATLPLVAWHFEAVPVLGVVSTLVAGPLVAAALPGLLLVVVLDLAGLPGTAVPAGGAGGLLALARTLVEMFAAAPWAVVPVTRPQVVAGSAGVLLAALALAPARGIGRETRALVLATGVASGLVLLPALDDVFRAGTLELHAIDVGQGDGLALRTPGGHWIVVDTGPDPGERLVRALRGLGVRRVALMVLTHPDLDHIGGAAEILEALPVDLVADPGTVRGSAAYREVLDGARARGAAWRVLSRGDTLRIDGVELAVLWPDSAYRSDDPNDRSVVLRVAWGGFSALLTGDAPVAAEARFAAEAGPVTILKVGHHGSLTSTGVGLLDAVRPELALVSAGRFNRFGHPAPLVVDRLRRRGIPLYRTDRHGSIEVRVQPGTGPEVRTEVPSDGRAAN
jgi:competence protein ComEC